MLDSAKPLWQASACDLAEAIAGRALSAEEAVAAAVERMRAVNPRLNAVVDDLGDAALAEAAAADRRLAERGPDGPLHGRAGHGQGQRRPEGPGDDERRHRMAPT